MTLSSQSSEYNNAVRIVLYCQGPEEGTMELHVTTVTVELNGFTAAA